MMAVELYFPGRLPHRCLPPFYPNAIFELKVKELQDEIEALKKELKE